MAISKSHPEPGLGERREKVTSGRGGDGLLDQRAVHALVDDLSDRCGRHHDGDAVHEVDVSWPQVCMGDGVTLPSPTAKPTSSRDDDVDATRVDVGHVP